MLSDFPEHLTAYIDGLVEDAREIESAAEDRNQFVEPANLARLNAGCEHLAQILGDGLRHWTVQLSMNPEVGCYQRVADLLGTLTALQTAIRAGVLQRVIDLARAETFGDLLEQADYLFAEGFTLPAGVIGRAVLEEHLRNWCDRIGAAPQKKRPMIGDFRQSLIDARKLTNIQAKHVESMAAVGNACAHNQPVQDVDVERLLRDVRAFIATTHGS
jgi:hypothetical protein